MTQIPQNYEVEKSVIASCIADKDCLSDVMSILEPSDFYDSKLQNIFSSIRDILQENKSITVFTLQDKTKINIDFFTNDILKNHITSAVVKDHCEIIKKHAQSRQQIYACHEAIKQISNGENTAINTLITKLFTTEKDHYSHDQEELIERNFDRVTNTNGASGVPFGFPLLDELTGGARKQNLILIAARPSQGKSAFLENLLINMLRQEKAALYISAESSESEEMARIIGRLSGLGHNALLDGLKNKQEEEKFDKGQEEFSKFKITMNDDPTMTTEKIFFQAMKLKTQGKLDVIFVDYAQMLKDKGESDVLRLDKISNGLKNIARKLDVPVISAVQFNREVSKRAGNEPILSDLKGSGAFEQDGDLIIGLYRDEQEEKQTNFKVLKQRNGKLFNFSLHFDGRVCEFY